MKLSIPYNECVCAATDLDPPGARFAISWICGISEMFEMVMPFTDSHALWLSPSTWAEKLQVPRHTHSYLTVRDDEG